VLTLFQITLSGFAFVVVNILTLLWYNPTLDKVRRGTTPQLQTVPWERLTRRGIPGLSAVGILDMVHRPLPLPDLRRSGWESSKKNTSERAIGRAIRSW
jgi:hypothetical protein